MTFDKRCALLFAVTAGIVGGAALVMATRRRHHHAASELEQTSELKSWENEGGSMAPAAVAQAVP